MYNERLNINTSIRQTSVNVSPQITQTSLSFSPAIDSSLTTWGSITGILENQTDLWEVLSGKISLTSLSSTATGLDYNDTTGVFSLESGYEIPLSSTLATFITKDVDDLTYYTKTEDLPPVNDGTLAIRQNGIDVGYFSANQSENSYIDIQTPTKTSDLTNDGDGVSPFATEYYVNTNAGKIDKIQKNGVDLPIVNKVVNISVPTKTSDLTNNSNFVSDANYVHTDNNFTNADLDKLSSIEAGAQVNDVNSVNGETGHVELTTSDIPNTSGYIDKDVYDLTYYMPTTTINSKLEQKQDKINDLSNIREGADLGRTSLQPGDNITELVNNAHYITTVTQSDVINALGYIPYSASNPQHYVNKDVIGLTYYTDNYHLEDLLNAKQNKLISGENIKTLNNISLLGSGNININSATWGNIQGNINDQTDLTNELDQKQPVLISGTNIKTINNESLLGSGNIDIQGGGGGAIGNIDGGLANSIYVIDQVVDCGGA